VGKNIVVASAEVALIQPARSPAIRFSLPAPEVTIVYFMYKMIVSGGRSHFIFTPIPGIGPIVITEIDYTAIQLFGITLKVNKVFKGFFGRHDRLLFLVQIFFATDEGRTAPDR